MATTFPLDEAARRLRIHPATLRRRLKRGELRGVQEPTGQGFRWLIEVPDAAAAAAPTQEAPDATATLTLTLERDALAQEVRRLSVHTDDLRTQLESRTREVAQLHTLLAQAHQRLLADGQADRSGNPTDRNGSAPAPEWGARRWWQRLLWG